MEDITMNPIDEINPTVTSIPTIIPTGDERYLNIDSDYIFDQKKLPTFELNIPIDDYKKIDADPSAEQYVAASLTFEGETLSPIGVRYKGSIGAFVNCLSGNNFANPMGFKTCTKLSMKVKINWEGSDSKFYGLKKLQFHSMNNDNSQMRERLGYHLFRTMGIPAPRAIHARLVINGEFMGLFALVEQIDGRFTRYHFDDGKGNLYKELWPLNHDSQPHTPSRYINALKTNEDENPSIALMQNFATEIATAEDTAVPDVIEKWMDIDKIITYAVVDRTIRNDDGAFHWYCNGGDCSPHNFYWYEETNREKLHLIPWDLDHAFENIITDINPVVAIADDWGQTRSNCQPYPYGFLQVRQRSAACDKLIAGWVTFEDLYQQKREIFIDGAFSASALDGLLAEWEMQIRPVTVEARAAHGDAIKIEEWEAALAALKRQLEWAKEH